MFFASYTSSVIFLFLFLFHLLDISFVFCVRNKVQSSLSFVLQKKEKNKLIIIHSINLHFTNEKKKKNDSFPFVFYSIGLFI